MKSNVLSTPQKKKKELKRLIEDIPQSTSDSEGGVFRVYTRQKVRETK